MSELIFSVREIFDDTTRKGCLPQYGCLAYNIPPYQRGYKWGSEDKEPVERLLSDLTEAWKAGAKEYLLQAITVKKVSTGESGSVLEVIDGQQRLTTLFILLSTLDKIGGNQAAPGIAKDKLRYSIRHKNHTLDDLVSSAIHPSGADSTAGFDELKMQHKVEGGQQDDYYLKCAALRCFTHLRIKEGTAFSTEEKLLQFSDFVVHKVKLMINAVEPHISGEVIFGNLNTNRVVLTETELIKGLLLTRVAREPSTARSRQYRETLEMRIQLGRKWDEIHKWSNAPDVKSFYFSSIEGNDAIKGLMELVARQMPLPFNPKAQGTKERHPLFEYFLQQRHIEPVFRCLSDTHARLQDWYADDRTYHLLGYCLMHEQKDQRLPFLTNCLKCETRSEFATMLRKKQRKHLIGQEDNIEASAITLKDHIGKLHYGTDDVRIISILLALSVFQAGQAGRFNFRAYQDEDWSLEHIFPQTPFGKNARLSDMQRNAVIDLLINDMTGIISEDTKSKMADARAGSDKSKMEDEISKLLKSVPILHQIGNLCLLRRQDNSSMGCGMFDDKRKDIRERIAQGSFVPRHTYAVFSKMIVGESGDLTVWSKEDIEKHQDAVVRQLESILKEDA
jgi:hypothetical protein